MKSKEILEKELRIELLNKGFSSSETDFLIQKAKEGYFEKGFEKGFGKDLEKRFPNGQWKTINGARVFINGGKVVAGLDNFNGMIDDFFKEKKGKEGKDFTVKDIEDILMRGDSIPKDVRISLDERKKLLSKYGAKDVRHALVKIAKKRQEEYKKKQEQESAKYALTDKEKTFWGKDKKAINRKIKEMTGRSVVDFIEDDDIVELNRAKKEAVAAMMKENDTPKSGKKGNVDLSKKNISINDYEKAIKQLADKQKEAKEKFGFTDHYGMMHEKLRKEFPKEYEQANKNFEPGNPETRQQEYDTYYKKKYPDAYKAISELESERKNLSGHLGKLGVSYLGGSLDKLGVGSFLQSAESVYESILSDINHKKEMIETSKDKKKTFDELSKLSLDKLKGVKNSYEFQLESDYNKKNRENTHPELTGAMKNVQSHLKEYMEGMKVETKNFGVGDKVFVKQAQPNREAGIAHSNRGDESGEVTKITDRFMYIDGKRYPKEPNNVYKIIPPKLSKEENNIPKLSKSENDFFENSKKRMGVSDKDLPEINKLADKIAKIDKEDRHVAHFAEALQYYSPFTKENLKDADTFIKNSPYDPEDTVGNQFDKILSDSNLERMVELGVHKDTLDKVMPDLKEVGNFVKDVKGKNDKFGEILISKTFSEGGVKSVKEFKDMYSKVPKNVPKDMVAFYAYKAVNIKNGDYSDFKISKVPRAIDKRKQIVKNLNKTVDVFKKMNVKIPKSVIDKEIKKLKLD